ncbi:MAG: hypothetical protein K1W16_03120 [Lachnospiraceae bacterium]
MTECFALIKKDYKEVCRKYMSITGVEDAIYKAELIICDDIWFENRNGWCLMTLWYDDEIAEEILLELSDGNKLLYFFSDDVQLDCEFLVIDNRRVIRKKYICFDLPELNCDEGHLKVEEKIEFLYWNDIDYFVNIAREDPEKLFES